MRIAVFGAGAMGSLLGGKLSQHFPVLLIGREEHMKAIRSYGMKIEGVTELTAHPEVCTSPAERPDFLPDVVFITTKAYDTAEAAREISEVWSAVPVVVSMQNGIGNADVISSYLSDSSVLTVLTTHGATFVEPGRILHAGVGRTVLGHSVGPKGNMVLESVRYILETAGFETEISGDIERDIWIKAGINASINPITAVLSEKNGVIARSEGLKEVVRDVCLELERTATAYGIAIDADDIFQQTITTAEMTAGNTSSMLQDIMAGRRTEIEQINGEIVREARKKGISVPVVNALYRMVQEIS